MNVTIYIHVTHTGHLKYGTGLYSIALEYISEKYGPIVKEYFGGLSGTTANRNALSACISALGHIVIIPCDIKLIINSEYIAQAVNNNNWIVWINTGLNAKGKPATNLDLWQQLYELANKHNITFECAQSNPYTLYMQSKAKKALIESIEDIGNNNQR